MINCNKNISIFEGTPKDLCMEIAYIIGGVKETFIKEFNLTEADANVAIAESIKIGLMNNWERKEYLDGIIQNYIDRVEFDKL